MKTRYTIYNVINDLLQPYDSTYQHQYRIAITTTSIQAKAIYRAILQMARIYQVKTHKENLERVLPFHVKISIIVKGDYHSVGKFIRDLEIWSKVL